jgi:Protein of unknown function (DUF1360)
MVVGVLAVARITRLLVEDQLMVKYRQWVVRKWGETSMAAYLAHCPWCTSIWVAIAVMPIAVLFPVKGVIAAFAVPAASMITGLLADRKE